MCSRAHCEAWEYSVPGDERDQVDTLWLYPTGGWERTITRAPSSPPSSVEKRENARALSKRFWCLLATHTLMMMCARAWVRGDTLYNYFIVYLSEVNSDISVQVFLATTRILSIQLFLHVPTHHVSASNITIYIYWYIYIACLRMFAHRPKVC